jgi:predicted Fe-Mo cluster-binding NifX family protein
MIIINKREEVIIMKICVTSQGDNLDAQVDPRFGRCQYFVIVDTDTIEFEAIRNPNIDAMGGAGIQSGQIMVDKKVKAVVTGNVGPNAFQTLQSAGITVITGVSGSVREAIEKYKKGELKPTQGPTTGAKFSMAATENEEVIEMPRGQGQGSGMGKGIGRGGGAGGMGGNRRGGGPGGNCICPKCGEKVAHQQAVPCYSVNCPKCGEKMMRE